MYLGDCIDPAITNTRSISMAIFKPAMDKTLLTLHGNCILLKAHTPAPKILHRLASDKFWICYSRKRTLGMSSDRAVNNAQV
jgi:hypothetical protein